MTVIFGTFRDIGGELSQGKVTLQSIVTRPAHLSSSEVVTTERHEIVLRNGAFTSPELDPGPTRVHFRGNGGSEEWEITLPDDGRHDLATLIEMHVDYSPAVVGRVEAAAADANRAAQAAGLSATRAGEVEQRVIVVESRIDGIVADGAAAVRAELQSEIAGVDQARVDAQSAQAAAEAAASTASTKADEAAASATLADSRATDAEDAADRAVDARDGAEAARDEAVQAAASAATSAPAEGWPRASLSPDVQDSLSRADTALQSVPTTVPSGEEMDALWDALQSMDMITVDTDGYEASQELANLVEERGLTKKEVAYPTFGVRLTGAGNAQGLFQNWSALVRAPKVSGPSQVKRMDRMFSGCASLTTIPALDTSQVTNMYQMFSGCASLTTIPALDTSQVTGMDRMFYGCASLTTIPALDTSQVTGRNDMFYGCASLESVTLPGMGNGFTANRTLDMRDTKLDATAANALMESLGTPTPGGTLQLPATAAGADTSIATAKNWTVTIA